MKKEDGKTKPDTVLPIYLSVIAFFTQNEEFVKIYHFSYKYALLSETVHNLNSHNLEDQNKTFNAPQSYITKHNL
jgi:hypothetical protein